MTDVKTIDSKTLQKWLETGIAVSIIDIRPIQDILEWVIPQSISLNVYDKLKVNDETAFDTLYIQKNIPVVVVCAGGKLSLTGAEILQKKGFDAYSLNGGINQWILVKTQI